MSWCKNNGDNRLLPAPVALSCQLPRTYEAYNCCTSQSCFFAATNLNLWDGCQSIQSQGEFDPKDALLVTISLCEVAWRPRTCRVSELLISRILFANSREGIVSFSQTSRIFVKILSHPHIIDDDVKQQT